MKYFQQIGGPDLVGAILVFGSDVTGDFQLEPFQPYFVRKVLGFINYQRIIRGTRDVLSYPVELPNTAAHFYGYEVHGLLTTGGMIPGFRTLVNLITQGATVVIGIMSGQQVFSKKQAVALYSDQYEFSDFVRASFAFFHGDLKYQLPHVASQRRQAVELCGKMVGYENYVLRCARQWIEGWPLLDPGPLHKQMMDHFARADT